MHFETDSSEHSSHLLSKHSSAVAGANHSAILTQCTGRLPIAADYTTFFAAVWIALSRSTSGG